MGPQIHNNPQRRHLKFVFTFFCINGCCVGLHQHEQNKEINCILDGRPRLDGANMLDIPHRSYQGNYKCYVHSDTFFGSFTNWTVIAVPLFRISAGLGPFLLPQFSLTFTSVLAAMCTDIHHSTSLLVCLTPSTCFLLSRSTRTRSIKYGEMTEETNVFEVKTCLTL